MVFLKGKYIMILSKLWKKILFILSNEAKIFAFFFLFKVKTKEKIRLNYIEKMHQVEFML